MRGKNHQSSWEVWYPRVNNLRVILKSMISGESANSISKWFKMKLSIKSQLKLYFSSNKGQVMSYLGSVQSSGKVFHFSLKDNAGIQHCPLLSTVQCSFYFSDFVILWIIQFGDYYHFSSASYYCLLLIGVKTNLSNIFLTQMFVWKVLSTAAALIGVL